MKVKIPIFPQFTNIPHFLLRYRESESFKSWDGIFSFLCHHPKNEGKNPHISQNSPNSPTFPNIPHFLLRRRSRESESFKSWDGISSFLYHHHPKKWKSTSRRTASASYTTVCWRIFPYISPYFPKFPNIPHCFYIGAVENLRALKAETGYLLSSTTTTQKNESQRHVGLLQQVTPRCVGAYQ